VKLSWWKFLIEIPAMIAVILLVPVFYLGGMILERINQRHR
jgi:hypothetical protein